MIGLNRGGKLLLLVGLLCLPLQLHAASAPFDIDLKDLDRQETPAPAKSEKKKPQRVKKPASARRGKAQNSSENEGEVRYTVQPGDHIYKILVARFGMSNEAAERLLPEIARLNNLSNIRNLSVGQTLLIPGRGGEGRVARQARKEKARHGREVSETAAPPEKSSPRESREVAVRSEPATPVAPVAVPPRVPPAALPPAQPVPAVAAVPVIPVPQLAPFVAKPAPLAVDPAPAAVEPVPVAVEPAPAAEEPAPVAAVEPAPTAVKPAVSPTAPARATVPPVAAVAPPVPAPPAAPMANTWICSVTERDTSRMVDAVLNALSVSWSKNRIIQSVAPTSFSIRVDRYFEYKDARYIVSIGEFDPYNYTLIRLLEGAGYRVLRIGGREDFDKVGQRLLALIGVVPDFGRHLLQEGKSVTGFLVQQDDAGGRRVIISGEPADPHQKWLMPSGCGAR